MTTLWERLSQLHPPTPDPQAIHPFIMDLSGMRSGPLQGAVYDFSDTHGRPFYSDWAGINMGWLPRLWILRQNGTKTPP